MTVPRLNDVYRGWLPVVAEGGEAILIVAKPVPGWWDGFEKCGKVVRTSDDDFEASIETTGAAAVFAGLPKLDRELGRDITQRLGLSATIRGESLEAVARRVDEFLIWAHDLGPPEGQPQSQHQPSETQPEHKRGWRSSFRD